VVVKLGLGGELGWQEAETGIWVDISRQRVWTACFEARASDGWPLACRCRREMSPERTQLEASCQPRRLRDPWWTSRGRVCTACLEWLARWGVPSPKRVALYPHRLWAGCWAASGARYACVVRWTSPDSPSPPVSSPRRLRSHQAADTVDKSRSGRAAASWLSWLTRGIHPIAPGQITQLTIGALFPAGPQLAASSPSDNPSARPPRDATIACRETRLALEGTSPNPCGLTTALATAPARRPGVDRLHL